jgi:hypothetical protein
MPCFGVSTIEKVLLLVDARGDRGELFARPVEIALVEKISPLIDGRLAVEERGCGGACGAGHRNCLLKRQSPARGRAW